LSASIVSRLANLRVVAHRQRRAARDDAAAINEAERIALVYLLGKIANDHEN
jgi:hypothetical protein